jgi:hypothetical protein
MRSIGCRDVRRRLREQPRGRGARGRRDRSGKESLRVGRLPRARLIFDRVKRE